MSDIRSFFGGKVVGAAKEASVRKSTPVSAPIDVPVADHTGTSTGKENNTISTAVSSKIGCQIVCEGLPADVQKVITWKAGEPVPYLAMVDTFEEISRVSGRLEKENLFARLFRAVIATTPTDLDVIVYLASNEVSPVYEGRELGIGDSLLVKAVCEATGRKKDAVEEGYEKEGDLGTVALISRANQKTLSFAAKPKPLLARDVLAQFRVICDTKGDKAQARKVDIIKALMVKCQGAEAKYIVRALQGKLRIGTAQQTVLVALAHAFSDAQILLAEGSALELVRRRVAEEVQEEALKGGMDGAEEEDEAVEEAVEEEVKSSRAGAGAKQERRGTASRRVIADSDDEDEDEDEEGLGEERAEDGGDAGAGSQVGADQEELKAERAAVAATAAAVSAVAPEGSLGGEGREGPVAAAQGLPVHPVDTATPQQLQDMIAAVHDRPTPESVKMRAFALAIYPYSVQGPEGADSAAQRAFNKANAKFPKEERWQSAEVAVKRAFSECPNLTLLTRHLIEHPLHELHRHSRLTIGLPVAPMLAKPTKEIGEVLRRLSGLAFTMEYKYDGERAQVHLLDNGSVKIYSRNSEDNSEKYPDLRDIVRTAKVEGVTSCILDAEVVAYDRENKCLLPFQVLSTRKRKVEAGEEDTQKVKVILQIFDLLYINGRSLLRESLRTRRTLMNAAFAHTEGLLHFASGLDHVENGDTAPIETFLQEACAAQCEGLMVKTLDDNASYEPSKRSLNWLKLKKDYIDGMGVCDSVDLVVIGGYLGRGKRVNTYGAYLMACYDPDRDEFQSVCKVGTGFKDEDLARLYAQMKPLALSSQRRPLNYNVNDVLTPDHWFEASVVWELQAADLSKSSVHSGGAGRIEAGRGIGLRFPRYIRDRSDKKAEGATTAEQVVDMFFNQGLAGEGNGNNGEDDADVDDDWL